MERKEIKRSSASVRQLAVTAFAGGLAPASAGAAWGWQGVALAIPMVLLAGGISTALASRWSSVERCLPGHIIKVCYGLLGVGLMARGFSRSASRLAYTGGGGTETKVWLVILLVVPLVWMSLGKREAFFRTAEIVYPAISTVALAVLLWAAFHVNRHYLLEGPVSITEGMLAAAESAGLFLFAIPYIYREEIRPGEGRRAMGWLTALLAGTLLLSLVTVGVLSPAVLPAVEEPFFTMAAALGRSVRVEGLVSALWLLSDMVYLGFLSLSWHRAGKERDWIPAVGIIFAAIFAGFGLLDRFPEAVFGLGTVVLWGISALVLWVGGKR